MRALAEHAKVNLAATTYHFGSKKTLYVETFLRRFRAVNSRRLELLAAADAAAHGQPLPVEDIVDCMMRPSVEAGLEHPAFNKLVARTLLAPPKFLHEYLKAELEPNMQGLRQCAGARAAGGADRRAETASGAGIGGRA